MYAGRKFGGYVFENPIFNLSGDHGTKFTKWKEFIEFCITFEQRILKHYAENIFDPIIKKYDEPTSDIHKWRTYMSKYLGYDEKTPSKQVITCMVILVHDVYSNHHNFLI